MLIDVEDKIIRTIRDKNKQLQVNNLPGILCIYTGSRTADLEKIYHDEFDKIHMYLQSYPNISAVVLSTYSEFYDLESKNQQILKKKSKILIPIKPAFGNSEINIIWINEHARIKLPSIFIDTYQNYEKHINKIMGPP